ncbi:Uncharacterised protein [Mycobacterium tuberculosis]|nr:Uncharacterised protein [Mycobacterium tuberculosis]
MEKATMSCINSRLELLPAIRLGTAMPSSSAKIARRPGRPCWPP